MPDDAQLVESHLSKHRGSKVYLLKPQRGEKAQLMKMAEENAQRGLQEQHNRIATRRDLMDRLGKRLMLDQLPQRIECFDNSNLGGTLPVAAMVVFENGHPDPNSYRHYKIKYSGIPDDYAYMAEVLSRRFQKSTENVRLPDLLLVDGGKGQLNVALKVLEKLGLSRQFGVAGIAKKDEAKGDLDDKIYLPQRSNPVTFGKDSDLLLFLQRVRDEAHRFAIGYQRQRRAKSSVQSVLDEISGIGPIRKRLLLKHFGSIGAIKEATVEDLRQLPGISIQLAESILAQLNT
jgi:excinuclease ABC subunit C